MSFSFGVESVYAAQRCSRELSDSVWSVRFYEHLLDVLANDTWQSYPSEAFGRPCRFERLADFLVSPDGLGWPAAPEVLEMMAVVSRCNPPPPPRQNEPADPPINEWARKALQALGSAGLNVATTKTESTARQMLSLKDAQFAQAGDNRHTLAEPSLDIVKTTDQGDGGNSAAYLAARLKKAERDDLLAEIGPGKRFQSVRAAAIEAGIIKPVPTIRLTNDMPAVAAKLCQHLTREQRIQLIDLLAPEL